MVFAQGLIKVLRVGFRVEEAFAPPKRQAKLREFREKMTAMERDKQEVLAATDSREQIGTDAMYDAMEKFTTKYGSPESVTIVQEGREQLQAMRSSMDAEGERLKELKAKHEGNPTGAVAAFRAYVEAHPDTELGHSSLVGALRESGKYDAAIQVCEQRIADAEQGSSDIRERIRVYTQKLAIGSLLIEKGDAIRAVAHIEAVIKNASGDDRILAASTYLMLGEAYCKGGNIVAAKKAWNDAVKQDTTGDIKKAVDKRLQEIA